MRYGNSGGKNKGKKYFKRSKEANYEPIGEENANSFRSWMNEHYSEVVSDLKRKSVYDEDVFNETYLRIYETLLYSESAVQSFKGYFMRAYFTNKTQISIKEKRYVCAELKGLDFEQPTINIEDFERKIQTLEKDIFDYVCSNYELHEFEIFKMYVTLKPAINYNSLADITKVHAKKIHRIVSKIKRDLAKNEKFTKQRKEIII